WSAAAYVYPRRLSLLRSADTRTQSAARAFGYRLNGWFVHERVPGAITGRWKTRSVEGRQVRVGSAWRIAGPGGGGRDARRHDARPVRGRTIADDHAPSTGRYSDPRRHSSGEPLRKSACQHDCHSLPIYLLALHLPPLLSPPAG